MEERDLHDQDLDDQDQDDQDRDDKDNCLIACNLNSGGSGK